MSNSSKSAAADAEGASSSSKEEIIRGLNEDLALRDIIAEEQDHEIDLRDALGIR